MRILAKTTEISHEQWLELRRTGIGGSDAATVCGLNPFSSRIELWADKTGRLAQKDETEAMRIGHDLENYVAQRFSEATGKKVRRRNAIFQHDTYDFITANVDREIIGENAGLECKTTSPYNKSDFENGEIPLNYLVQCRHYMNVMGYERMYLAVIILGKGFYWYEIPYDAKEGDTLLQMEVDFWNNHIIPDCRPDPDGSESAGEVLKALYDKQRDEIAVLPDGDDNAAELLEVKAKIKALKTREDELTQLLLSRMDGCIYGETMTHEFSWKQQSKTTVDGKKLKEIYPEIYNKCSNTSTYKVFRIKERK